MAKAIAPVDLEFLVADSKIPLNPIPAQHVKINPMESAVFGGLEPFMVGFAQVPSKEHGRLNTHCVLSNISFTAQDGLSYVPVFVFERNDRFFDPEIYQGKSFEGLSWIALYHGNDNCSYGRRFRSEFDALRFVKKGFVNGFENVSGKLDFYNS